MARCSPALLARQERWPTAAERVNEALQAYRALSLRWDEAWASYQWGSVAVARGPEARRAEARAALSTAHELWSAMGAQRFSRQARAPSAADCMKRGRELRSTQSSRPPAWMLSCPVRPEIETAIRQVLQGYPVSCRSSPI